MSILNSVIKAFVGDKAKKDVKELQPLLKQIKSFEAAMETLTMMHLGKKHKTLKLTITRGIRKILHEAD